MEGRNTYTTTTTVGNWIRFLFHACCSNLEPRHLSHPIEHFRFWLYNYTIKKLYSPTSGWYYMICNQTNIISPAYLATCIVLIATEPASWSWSWYDDYNKNKQASKKVYTYLGRVCMHVKTGIGGQSRLVVAFIVSRVETILKGKQAFNPSISQLSISLHISISSSIYPFHPSIRSISSPSSSTIHENDAQIRRKNLNLIIRKSNAKPTLPLPSSATGIRI